MTQADYGDETVKINSNEIEQILRIRPGVLRLPTGLLARIYAMKPGGLMDAPGEHDEYIDFFFESAGTRRSFGHALIPIVEPWCSDSMRIVLEYVTNRYSFRRSVHQILDLGGTHAVHQAPDQVPPDPRRRGRG